MNLPARKVRNISTDATGFLRLGTTLCMYAVLWTDGVNMWFQWMHCLRYDD